MNFRKLEEWAELAESLKKLKDEEMVLRKECVELFGSDFITGKREVDLGDGYKAVCEIGSNYSVSDDVAEILDKITDDDVIHWKPNIRMAVYKNLGQDDMNALTPYVTIKPAAPTIKILEPKK